MRPGVTVVIPVKDRARLLAETLRSVREQSRPVDEIFVVDDGSTDNSASVARENGATVLTMGGPSMGPSVARNYALARVETDMALPLDSDDLLVPRAVEAFTDALANNPTAPFAFGQALEAHREGDGWHPEVLIAPFGDELAHLPCSLYARNFVPSTVLGRTRAILDAGGYPEALFDNEDHYLWIQMARRDEPVHVSRVLTFVRRHPGNRHDPFLRDALEEITRLADEDPRLLPCRPERLGVQLLITIAGAARARRPAEAVRSVWDLCLRQPHRRRILRSAFAHRRTWRVAAHAAQEQWSGDAELRSALNAFE
jgi:glycosyltransferase involved in cell wall biosynthesis